MVYLMGQISSCLFVAALLGGIVGWLLKQLRCRVTEQMLRRELDEGSDLLEVARGKAALLKADLADAHRHLESRTRRLESRIQELEPFPDIVRRREETISRLQNEVRSAVGDPLTNLAGTEGGPIEPASPRGEERFARVPQENDKLK